MTTTTTSPAPIRLPWWVTGDTNAFFGLGFNVMVNVLVLTGLCLGVVHIPGTDVFGVILPAMGVQLLIGNVYYTYLARRLARREGRTDVCRSPLQGRSGQDTSKPSSNGTTCRHTRPVVAAPWISTTRTAFS